MNVQREDLVAAAALGVLQYRQIDPLLIFLLQRDVRVHREAMLANAGSPRTRKAYAWLWLLAGALLAAMVPLALFTLHRATG